jgi:hypothetical protein
MVKAIKIDSKNKTITEVDDVAFDTICSLLGEDVNYFTVVGVANNVDMFVDDGALLKDAYIDEDENGNIVKHNMYGMKIKGYDQVIMGNGLVMGVNECGDSIDCPILISDVEEMITFVELDDPKDVPQPQMFFISF